MDAFSNARAVHFCGANTLCAERCTDRATEETDEEKALKFLQKKLKKIHADQIGAWPFVGPKQQRITVSDLLDSREADYKLRGKDSAQVKAHLKPVSENFGDWRAFDLRAEAADRFLSMLLGGSADTPGKAPATVDRSTLLLAQAFSLAVER